MPELNDFSERYKHLNDLELLRIVRHAEQYQPEAVAAAQLELDSRNLVFPEIVESDQDLPEGEEGQDILEAYDKEIKDRSLRLEEVLEVVIPYYRNTPKLIKVITIAFFALSAYQLTMQLIYPTAFIHLLVYNPFRFLYYLHPMLLLIIGTILFWRRKRPGWMLLVMYSVFAVINTGLVIFHSLTFMITQSAFVRIPYSSVLFILFVIMLLLICALTKREVREAFLVNTQRLSISVVAGVLLPFVPAVLNNLV